MNRRAFLRTALYGTPLVGVLGTTCYGIAQTKDIAIVRQSYRLANLPPSFRGLKIAFLTDLHHGPNVSLDYIASVVRTTMAMEPDLVLLGGDYISRSPIYARPCFEVLSSLKARLGIFGVLGNHDYWHGFAEVQEGFRANRFEELTNRGVWLTQGNDRLRLCGVDDLWAGRPDDKQALADLASHKDACIMLCHNPDFCETMTDRRPGLVLSGHTHGGQVVLPELGAPWAPTMYGEKYLHGMVEAPSTRVYVSAGIGLSGVPVRIGRKPEITLFTLI